jgi:diketogulonate reductase-like aldo/keto reductase
MYGSSESVVGDLAAGLGITGRLFMATKVWTSGREAGIRQMEESMRRMKVARMDLMQIHNLLDWRTHLKTLQEWKASERIRYTGITHYHSGAYGDLERLMMTRSSTSCSSITRWQSAKRRCASCRWPRKPARR